MPKSAKDNRQGIEKDLKSPMDSNQITSALKSNARRVLEGWFLGAVVSDDLNREVSAPYAEELAQLSNTLGIKIVTNAASHERDFSYQPLDNRLCATGADLLVSQLSIYPVNVIRKSQISKIVLCSNLRHSHGPFVSGYMDVSSSNTLVLGVEFTGRWHHGRMTIHHELFHPLDFLRLDQLIDCQWQHECRAVHHELFHAIDYHDDALHFLDPWWESLNAPGFHYCSGRSHFVKPCQTPGFLTNYSITAVEEDKAEVFSHLIVEYNKVQLRCQKDPILKRKVERMKQLLQQFCPDFNNDFWQKRQNAKSVFPVFPFFDLEIT